MKDNSHYQETIGMNHAIYVWRSLYWWHWPTFLSEVPHVEHLKHSTWRFFSLRRTKTPLKTDMREVKLPNFTIRFKLHNESIAFTAARTVCSGLRRFGPFKILISNWWSNGSHTGRFRSDCWRRCGWCHYRCCPSEILKSKKKGQVINKFK